jgi:hypothetical protein
MKRIDELTELAMKWRDRALTAENTVVLLMGQNKQILDIMQKQVQATVTLVTKVEPLFKFFYEKEKKETPNAN